MKTKYYCETCLSEDHKIKHKGCKLKMNGRSGVDHGFPSTCVIGGDCRWRVTGETP
jgi:hypothetical protein